MDKIQTAADRATEGTINSTFNNKTDSKPTDGNNMGGQKTAQNTATEATINSTYNKGAKGPKEY